MAISTLARRIGAGAAALLVLLGALACAACSGDSVSPAGTQPPSGGTPAPARSTVAPVPSSGCSQPAAQAGAQTLTITSSGVQRTYRRFVPSSHDAPLPVVINLHGLLSNIDQQVAFSGFETLGESERFVVLTPQGVGTPPGWAFTESADNTDIVFLDAMLDEVESSICIDTARVYATGLSNGGMMSSLLACYEPKRIAAVGLVSGILHPPGCDASRHVPMIVFWGKQDPVLPYCGGVGPGIIALLRGSPIAGAPTPACPPANDNGFPPPADVVASWAKDEGCAADPALTQVATHVEHRVYGSCDAGSAVEFYAVADGGHAWPGSAVMATLSNSPAGALIGHTTDEIDASKLIWQFFQRYAVTP